MKPVILHVKNNQDMGELADILYNSKYKMEHREKNFYLKRRIMDTGYLMLHLL